jgi:hypothetical protein
MNSTTFEKKEKDLCWNLSMIVVKLLYDRYERQSDNTRRKNGDLKLEENVIPFNS